MFVCYQLCCFWTKGCLTLTNYGASFGKCPEGFRSLKLTAARKSIESQIPAIFKYWRDTISFHIQQLADIAMQELVDTRMQEVL